MKRTFIKKPVLANSMTDEFLRYHEDANNYRNNEAGFNKMYTILDKYGSDDEDVDVLFERATDEDKEKMLSLIKPVKASSQERGTVQTYRNRRNPNKYIEVKKGNDGHSYARQYMEWDRPDGKVKNYTGAKDAKRGRYSRARRDTIDQMLEDYDAVTSSSDISIIDAVVQKYQPEDTDYIVYDYSLDSDTLELYASGDEGIEDYDGDEDLDYRAIMDIERWASRIAKELEERDEANDSLDNEEFIDALTADINTDWYSGMSVFGEGGPFTYDGITYTAYIEE